MRVISPWLNRRLAPRWRLLALRFLCSLPDFTEKERRFLRRIYKNTGIEKRHTVIGDYGKQPSEYRFYSPTADLKPEPSLEKRNGVYITEGNRLSLQAAAGLFEKPGSIDPGTVTHLITVSCTGLSAPGFSDHLVRELRLAPHVQRYHLGFMGCYAAIPALKLAETICRADANSRVLIVALELSDDELWASYEVLRKYGNMSSATVLFVLEELLRKPDTGMIFAAAFGPGLTVEAACLEKR